MPASKAKNLTSLFCKATKTTTPATTTAATTTTSKASSLLTFPAEDATLKHFVSSIDTSSPITTSLSEHFQRRRSLKSTKTPKTSPLLNLHIDPPSDSEDPTEQLSKEISSILRADASVSFPDNENSLDKVLNVPWFMNLSHQSISQHRKEVSRERKQKWIFKSGQFNRFNRFITLCGEKLGTDATLHVFGKLGRETGLKEFNALIGMRIERARASDDEDVALEQIHKAFILFKSMREQGFQLEEETYGPLLMYLIDMGMVQEFHFFCGVIKEENPRSLSRLGYYEMLLWVGVNDEEKIWELCNDIAVDDGVDKTNLRENYLLALCESNREKELLELLEIVDITKLSPPDCVANIFKSLGRLVLESFAEKFLVAFKTCDYEAENISNFIFSYAVSIPNLAVEDVISKFKNFHAKLEVMPSSASYEELITYCCDSLKVHAAFDIVDEMLEAGLTLSIEVVHSILHATEESWEFNLVRRIHSMIFSHDLKPNTEIFRSMISLYVKMKDFDAAYGMLNDLGKMNLTPTAGMYNAIMAGYFRQKNNYGALMVLKQMELADVKPDSVTFSYLISNCDREEDVVKYYEEMKQLGVLVTKHIFMALINAYTNCGQFDKAKQVALDKGIPVKSLNEIKSVLVSALASHGQMSDALNIYEEIKQARCYLVPKAVISLIEHLQSDGELNRLLQLLEELNDPDYWVDGCCRTILYCVRYKHIRTAADLLKKLKDKFHNDELAIEVLFDEVFSLIGGSEEPIYLKIGLVLLQVIKDELGLSPSRKYLDFLLSACVNAKDMHSAHLIWEEYKAAGLPHNVLSFLRMYQVLLASGDHKSAKVLLEKIPKDDPHVRIVIKACRTSYIVSNSVDGKKKKKIKNK